MNACELVEASAAKTSRSKRRELQTQLKRLPLAHTLHVLQERIIPDEEVRRHKQEYQTQVREKWAVLLANKDCLQPWFKALLFTLLSWALLTVADYFVFIAPKALLSLGPVFGILWVGFRRTFHLEYVEYWKQEFDRRLESGAIRWTVSPLATYERQCFGAPVPLEVLMLAKELEMRHPDGKSEVEWLYVDPLFWFTVGSERYCLRTW